MKPRIGWSELEVAERDWEENQVLSRGVGESSASKAIDSRAKKVFL